MRLCTLVTLLLSVGLSVCMTGCTAGVRNPVASVSPVPTHESIATREISKSADSLKILDDEIAEKQRLLEENQGHLDSLLSQKTSLSADSTQAVEDQIALYQQQVKDLQDELAIMQDERTALCY